MNAQIAIEREYANQLHVQLQRTLNYIYTYIYILYLLCTVCILLPRPLEAAAHIPAAHWACWLCPLASRVAMPSNWNDCCPASATAIEMEIRKLD